MVFRVLGALSAGLGFVSLVVVALDSAFGRPNPENEVIPPWLLYLVTAVVIVVSLVMLIRTRGLVAWSRYLFGAAIVILVPALLATVISEGDIVWPTAIVVAALLLVPFPGDRRPVPVGEPPS